MVRDLPDPAHLNEGSCVGACFLYRRRVYEEVGEYDTHLFLAEDYDYWLRISQRYPIAHVAEVAPYAALCHNGSLTERRRADVEIQCARARAKHSPTRLRAYRHLSAGYFTAAYIHRDNRRLGLALRNVLKAISWWPLSLRNYRFLVGLGLTAINRKGEP